MRSEVPACRTQGALLGRRATAHRRALCARAPRRRRARQRRRVRGARSLVRPAQALHAAGDSVRVCGREAESAHGSVTRSGFCRLARCRSGALCTLMAAQRCRELACIGAQVRRWRRRQRLAAGPAAHVPGARAGAAAADRRLQRDWRLRPRRARAAAGGLPRAHHAPGAARPAPARAALRAAGRAPGGAGCARVCLEGAL